MGSTVAAQPAVSGKNISPAPPEDMGRHRYLVVLAATICFAAFTYCSLAAFWPKFSRAEVFFAECAREMIVSNNYVTPLYHKQPFFDKPILVYWLIISMFKLFGLSHFAARIPSIACALGTLLLTGAGCTALYGRRSGLIAASTLATSFMFLSFASLCMSDMLLVFFDSLTLGLLYIGIQNAKRRDWLWLCAAVSMGLAFLTKGPIGIVLPLATFFVFLLVTRQFGIISLRHAFLAVLTVALVSSPWFAAVYRANGVQALLYFFVHENLQRFTGSQYDAGKPFWYTIMSLFYGFAPWSVFLPLALNQFIRSVRQDGLKPTVYASLFLWLWVFIGVGFFCFSRGKCDYYTLPTYPAAAILTAKFIKEQADQRSDVLKIILAVFAVAFLASSIGCYAILMSCADATLMWWTVPVALLASGLAMLAVLAKNKYGACLGISALGIAAAVILFSMEVLPDIASMEPIGDYVRIVNTTPPETRIGVEEALHGWIDEISFQTGRHPATLTGASELNGFLRGPSTCLVLTSEDKLNQLSAGTRSHLNVLCRANVITHALTPGYVIQHSGNLQDPIPVVMVATPGLESSKK